MHEAVFECRLQFCRHTDRKTDNTHTRPQDSGSRDSIIFRTLTLSLRSLLLTHFRETIKAEILFPLIFLYNKKEYQFKKKIFLGVFSAFYHQHKPEPTLVPGVLQNVITDSWITTNVL